MTERVPAPGDSGPERKDTAMDPTMSAGPPRAIPSPEVLERKRRAALWSAVWEASQSLSYDQIREVVEGTLREIESDEP